MRRRRRKLNRKSIFIFVAVVIVNFAGIGYAILNDNLDISNNIVSGTMKPYFLSGHGNATSISIGANAQGSGVNTNWDDETGKKVMNIGGVMELGDEDRVSFQVANGGTVPMKLKGVTTTNVNKGLHLNLSPINTFNGGGGVLNIKGAQPGNYNFNIILKYIQWNK